MKTAAVHAVLGLASSLASAALSQVVGVAPNDQGLYKPNSNGKWKCLNYPDIILDFSQVNDDFCDCPDGSDEPGTSACPNGRFYCENKGHVPGYIKASQVNDGVCDYSQCCDGSDEWNTPVDCPSKCEEIHKEYEKQMDLEQKTYKTGVDKAQKTINAANKMRAKLEKNLENESAIMGFLVDELNRKQAALEEAQTKGGVDQGYLKVQSKIKESFEGVKSQVLSYFDLFTASTSNLKSLSEILDALVQTFNENLKDAAVKATVDNYLEHLKKYKETYESEKSESYQSFDAVKSLIVDKLDSIDLSKQAESLKSTFDEISSAFKNELVKHDSISTRVNDLETLLSHLIKNYNPNFNDPNVKQAVNSFQDFSVNRETFQVKTDEATEWLKTNLEEVERLAETIQKSEGRKEVKQEAQAQVNQVQQIPLIDRLKLKYRKVINNFLGLETKENYVSKITESKSDLKEAVEELQKDKEKSKKTIQSIEDDLVKDYGPQDILRPFKDISLKGYVGEYDYEMFYIGDIHQKGNNHNVKIGTFSGITVNDISPKQHQLILNFENGARCWNGPLRKGLVTVDCGAEPELIAVTEPEKCEYHFRVKAPIGCKVPSEVEPNADEVHDEL